MLIAGNLYPVRAETGSFDAGAGLLLLGNGKGDFKPITVEESGFYAAGDVRDLKSINNSDGTKQILVGESGAEIKTFIYSPKEK